MVCLHGFMDTWRTWELVLPALERRHDVLAPTLAGHAGGPPFDPSKGSAGLVDAVERAMDAAGFAAAHLVGNSLGGYTALHLAARGRALSVVALAPSGGWPEGAEIFSSVARQQAEMQRGLRDSPLTPETVVSTLAGRRSATALTSVAFEHIPPELLAHQLRGVAACDAIPMIDCALREGYDLDAQHVGCPVRIVWGLDDRLLPLPMSAVRYRRDWLPTADWIELDDVGHAPQLDVPLETAQLILDFTSG
ncbi:MAG: alpha/beta hydrolase fold protein [Solirubrobacteraceae bacterium]|nr:alpha/beta hydrolase fold protein [Solirubrobacteraceae bacterium]